MTNGKPATYRGAEVADPRCHQALRPAVAQAATDAARWMTFAIAPVASVPTVDIEHGQTTYASTFAEPLAYGARILHCDRARERTHRRLMRLHFLAGDRTAALRQYPREYEQRVAGFFDEHLASVKRG